MNDATNMRYCVKSSHSNIFYSVFSVRLKLVLNAFAPSLVFIVLNCVAFHFQYVILFKEKLSLKLRIRAFGYEYLVSSFDSTGDIGWKLGAKGKYEMLLFSTFVWICMHAQRSFLSERTVYFSHLHSDIQIRSWT